MSKKQPLGAGIKKRDANFNWEEGGTWKLYSTKTHQGNYKFLTILTEGAEQETKKNIGKTKRVGKGNKNGRKMNSDE